MNSDLNTLKSILKVQPQDYQLVVAIRGADEHLLTELAHKKLRVHWQQERFYLVDKGEEPLIWIQWCCSNFEMVEAESINLITQQLKKHALHWSNFTFDFHRRQALVADTFKFQGVQKRINFPEDYEKFQQNRRGGFWTLLEPNLLLIAKDTSSWRYLGEMEFNENKEEPPSRAYLKLWEAMMHLPVWPKNTDIVMDLGACPGGWTWVLKSFVQEVISVDKAPLATQLMKAKNVQFLQDSIFGLDPKKWQHVQWLFCDVICYPEKIFELIQKWITQGFKGNFVFTIKFQGETDFSVVKKLSKVEGSKLIHLYHNKHELTWIYLQNLG